MNISILNASRLWRSNSEWRQAALTDDVPEMDKLLSDDYLGITANGEVLTKAQELDHMRNHKLVITRLQVSDFKIKLIGRIAIVTSLAQVEGSLDGDAHCTVPTATPASISGCPVESGRSPTLRSPQPFDLTPPPLSEIARRKKIRANWPGF